MFRSLALALGYLFCFHIGYAVAGEELPFPTPELLEKLAAPIPRAPMEKCFALPDAKPLECHTDPDSDECTSAKKKPKNGSEFKFVPRESCLKLGGQIIAKPAKTQK